MIFEEEAPENSKRRETKTGLQLHKNIVRSFGKPIKTCNKQISWKKSCNQKNDLKCNKRAMKLFINCYIYNNSMLTRPQSRQLTPQMTHFSKYNYRSIVQTQEFLTFFVKHSS